MNPPARFHGFLSVAPLVTCLLVSYKTTNAHAALLWWDVPVCVQPGEERSAHLTISGTPGEATIVWTDLRNDSLTFYGTSDIYAQRFSPSGVPLWQANGVPVCTATGGQEESNVVPSGSGGVLVVWTDSRSGSNRIFAQRLDTNGQPLWAVNGVQVSSGPSTTSNIDVVSDGAGGAVITWAQWGGATPGIYAQRIRENGTTWGADVTLSSLTTTEHSPKVAPDGLGGWIFVWPDDRVLGQLDVFAQRVNSSGAIQWQANGIALTTSHAGNFPRVVTGPPGAIVVWREALSGDGLIYCMRIDASGGSVWPSPVKLSDSTGTFPIMMADGGGGAIVLFRDDSSGIFNAQRVSATGALAWGPQGVLVGAKFASPRALAMDGASGAWIAWQSQTPSPFEPRVSGYDFGGAQRSGYPLRTSYVTGASSSSGIADGAGGMILVVEAANNLYAARVAGITVGIGDTPSPLISAPRISIQPNPMGNDSRISFSLDQPSRVRLAVLDLQGREVARCFEGQLPAGSHQMRWDGGSRKGLAPSGLYFVRLLVEGTASYARLVIAR